MPSSETVATPPKPRRRVKSEPSVEATHKIRPAAKPVAKPVDATITELPVSLIDPGSNDRRIFDQDKLFELADSIRQNGLAQPITVRPMGRGKNRRYQIVAGER
jgi:ParB family chromosome partitioning protein